MKVVIVDSQASAWDSFVQSAQDATPYHQFKWKTVITKSFGHQCHYFGAIDSNGGMARSASPRTHAQQAFR